MFTKIKKRWLVALRSGKYQRGKGVLRSDNKFCCLGVLVDLYINSKDGKKAKACWKKDDNGKFHFYSSYGGAESLLLPNEVVKWAGLPDSNPELGEKFCSSCNDGNKTRDYSFKEIADKIELYL